MAISIFKKTTQFDFIGKRRFGYALSGAMIALCIFFILFLGIRYGVDFAGGAAVQVQFEQPIGDEAIKSHLTGLNLPGLAIQQFGDTGRDYLLRFSTTTDHANEQIRSLVTDALQTIPGNSAVIQRLETVGPKIGADLRNAALEAIFYALLLITVYISGRFEQRWMIALIMSGVLGGVMYLLGIMGLPINLRVCACILVTVIVCNRLKLNFALGAMVGLIHDVIVTVGILVMMGKEFDLNIIAALLTLVGYSLNDTIITYDRIRENLRLQDPQKPDSIGNIINRSVNQTLARTLMTSITTLLASGSLYFLGGSVIHDFALTMSIGVIVGTFSTIFICSPIIMIFGTTDMYIKATDTNQTKYERPGEHGVV